MAILTFLGTRGGIEEKTETHFYHSSLLVQISKPYPFRLLIDYGRIHAYSLSLLQPDALLITHGHPDHYLWTFQTADSAVPVYLTQEILSYGEFSPCNPKIIVPYRQFNIGPFSIFPYRVLHSIRCPAIGFKIVLPDRKIVLYNPDLVDIIAKEHILPGADYYIGDGSSIKTYLVRRKGEMLCGHTGIFAQLKWCEKYGIQNIIFTHLGQDTLSRIDDFSKLYPECALAYDRMKIAI